MNILEACDSPDLFRPWFKDPTTWTAWRAVLCAIHGLPMTEQELDLYRRCTGRSSVPAHVDEAWLVVGRRGGKSFNVALLGVYAACFGDYSRYLTPGERGLVVILAATKSQARVIFRYCKALIENVPVLARMVVASTGESIDLENGISIEVHHASFRSIRGRTVVAALLDEVAFWRSDESLNPDVEIINALRPAMATIPTALMLGISSPYAQRGVLWDTYRGSYGQDGPILVWQADTRTMNPSVPQSYIDKEYERDPVSAAAEYGAQFRSDVSGFLLSDWIDSAIEPNVFEIEPLHQHRYFAFTDPSGGGKDSFTLAIGHNEKGVAHLDLVRARKPPFSPDGVVAEFALLLQRYGITQVTGDRYAGQWVVEAFQKAGIQYVHSERSKSEIYLEAEPMFATGKCRVLDHKTLLNELRRLERRTSKSGKDTVDHPPGGHDDVANAVCGVLVLARGRVQIDLDEKECVTGDYYTATNPNDGNPFFSLN